MRTITKFVANDGSEWRSESEATERDAEIREVEAAMSALRPTPEDPRCVFANGGGYVQQTTQAVAEARRRLMVMTRRVLSTMFEEHGKKAEEAHPSYYCRMLDGSHRPIEKAWNRMMCIDSLCREWGQPYFGSHPEEGTQAEYREEE